METGLKSGKALEGQEDFPEHADLKSIGSFQD